MRSANLALVLGEEPVITFVVGDIIVCKRPAFGRSLPSQYMYDLLMKRFDRGVIRIERIERVPVYHQEAVAHHQYLVISVDGVMQMSHDQDEPHLFSGVWFAKY